MSDRPNVTADIDALDLKILTALRRNGRLKKIELSEQVGLSPTPCCVRLDRLERSRLISGYHAEVDLDRLARLSHYLVLISLPEYTPDKARRLEAEIAKIPFILGCEAVLGAVDYVLKVCAASVSHYNEIMEPLLVLDIDYTTYPISRVVERAADRSLLDLVAPPCRR